MAGFDDLTLAGGACHGLHVRGYVLKLEACVSGRLRQVLVLNRRQVTQLLREGKLQHKTEKKLDDFLDQIDHGNS